MHPMFKKALEILGTGAMQHCMALTLSSGPGLL